MLLGFDVSSYVMVDIGKDGSIDQAGATFYGSLLDHLTAAPIWVSDDSNLVTTVCPGKCYNCAWGRGDGDSVATKARKAQERDVQNAESRRVVHEASDMVAN